MAKVKIAVKRPSIRGWAFVLILGVVLAILAVIDRGGLAAVRPATGATGCELRVTVSQLNVRAGPTEQAEQVQTLTEGATVDGTAVTDGGFRQLKDGHWVFDQYVTPVAGSTCG